jgi:hypothetical protein
MIGYIKIRERGSTPGITKREWGRVKKTTFGMLGRWWHRMLRPKHFTQRGAMEYRYVPRKGQRQAPGTKGFRRSYTGTKLRRFGHTLPLVWSGASKRKSRAGRILATSKDVRVSMNVPTLNLKPKGGRINLRREMTVMSRAERMRVGRIADTAIQKQLKAIRTTRVRTIG